MVRRFHRYPSFYDIHSPYPHSRTTRPMPYTAGHYPTPFDVFAKPKQPMNWQAYPQSSSQFSETAQVNHLLQQFQDDDGALDIDKMLSAAGQMVTTVEQISPMVKQVGDLLKQVK